MKRSLSLLAVASALVVSLGSSAHAQVITNGDFGTGDLTGWTPFTTANGTVGGTGYPMVTTFDVTGTGATYAAELVPGEVSFTSVQEGGGLSQVVSVASDVTTTLSADVASVSGGNADDGNFSLLVDNTVVASWSAGSNGFAPGTLRDHLSGAVSLTAGTHTVQVEVTRQYLGFPGSTPTTYITNVAFAGTSSTPEPGTVALFGSLGITGVAFLSRRRTR